MSATSPCRPLIERGKVYLDKKDFATVKKYFDRVKLSYPNDKFLPWGLFYGAECDGALGNTDIAIKSLHQLLTTYPKHSLTIKAKARLKELEKEK